MERHELGKGKHGREENAWGVCLLIKKNREKRGKKN